MKPLSIANLISQTKHLVSGPQQVVQGERRAGEHLVVAKGHVPLPGGPRGGARAFGMIGAALFILRSHAVHQPGGPDGVVPFVGISRRVPFQYHLLAQQAQAAVGELGVFMFSYCCITPILFLGVGQDGKHPIEQPNKASHAHQTPHHSADNHANIWAAGRAAGSGGGRGLRWRWCWSIHLNYYQPGGRLDRHCSR